MNHIDDHFNRVKEFFEIETVALVVSTYLNTFDSTLLERIQLASNMKQRERLHNRIMEVLIRTKLMDGKRLTQMRKEDLERRDVGLIRCPFTVFKNTKIILGIVFDFLFYY